MIPNPYPGYRYPAEIISHALWLYFRFALSFRDLEEILAARGIIVLYEAVRQWCLTFGQQYANDNSASPWKLRWNMVSGVLWKNPHLALQAID